MGVIFCSFLTTGAEISFNKVRGPSLQEKTITFLYISYSVAFTSNPFKGREIHCFLTWRQSVRLGILIRVQDYKKAKFPWLIRKPLAKKELILYDKMFQRARNSDSFLRGPSVHPYNVASHFIKS